MDIFDSQFLGDIYCCSCGILLIEGSFSSQGWFCLECNQVFNSSKVVPILDKKRVREISYHCGNYEEVYQFECRHKNMVKHNNYKSSQRYEGFGGICNILNNLLFKSDIYYDINFGRRKKKIRRLINSNLYDVSKCSFITLTYKENMKRLDVAKKDFLLFIKRFKYHYPLFDKYLYVIERQKRGAIHFHIVFFDVPYINFKIVSDIWGKGFIDIHNVRDIKNLGSYLTKYLNKREQKENMSGRVWGYSKSLLKPKVKVSDLSGDINRDFDKLVFHSRFNSPSGLIDFTLFDNRGKEFFYDGSVDQFYKELPF